MANVAYKRVPPDIVEADVDGFRAFKAMLGYQSTNPAFSLAKVAGIHDRLRAAEDTAIQISAAGAAARDALGLVQRELHDAMLGVKDQVRAQYGADSDELASLGLKKKSERRTRPRKKVEVKEG